MVIIFIPNCSRTSSNHFKPSSPLPCQAYGSVLGLKHPALKTWTPIFANAKHEKSMRAGFNKEMNSNYYNTPTGKANLFDD